MNQKIAVLIPCLNEEKTIGKVVREFKKELPEAAIYMFDNNSTDKTAEIAAEEGAVVIKEKRPGKGYVIASMFQKVDTDIYVMVDGDDTYMASDVHALKPIVDHEADMVIGARVAIDEKKAFRKFHTFGNRLVINLIRWIFKYDLKDVMSGYRVFSKEMVDSLPFLSGGFEIETELTLQALSRDFVIKEIETTYASRPEGSFSKLSTFKDGFRVLWTIVCIFKDFKPLTFFGGIGIIFFILSMLSGAVVVAEYVAYRYIYRLPLAVLSVGLGITGLSFAFIGITLATINWRFKELYTIMRRGKLFRN